MKFSKKLLGSAVLASAAAHTISFTSPTVTTVNETYSGLHNANYGVDSFLGIPYAQPPVGQLRFRTPQSLNSSWKDVKSAVEYGHQCVGYGVSTIRIPSGQRLRRVKTE
jgi:carboxylesterase type B